MEKPRDMLGGLGGVLPLEEREPPSCLINQIKMGKSIFLVWHLSLIDDFTLYHTTVTWVRHGLCFTDRTSKNHIPSSFPFLNLKDDGKNRQIYVVNICMLKLQLSVSFTDWLYYLSSVKLCLSFLLSDHLVSWFCFSGDPILDLIPIHLDIFRGDSRLLKQFLKSYGLALGRKRSLNELVKDNRFHRLSYRAM